MESKLDREILAEIEGYDVKYVSPAILDNRWIMHRHVAILNAYKEESLLKLISTINLEMEMIIEKLKLKIIE